MADVTKYPGYVKVIADTKFEAYSALLEALVGVEGTQVICGFRIGLCNGGILTGYGYVAKPATE